MYLLLVIIVWVLFAWRFIDWTQWRRQYPTVLFFMLSNFLYNYFYYNHTLWAFRGVTLEWLNHSIINAAFTFIICPAGLVIFLQRMPDSKAARVYYVAVWIGFYTALEWLFSMKGMYVYDHGWNNWLNIPLNTLLFLILAVHYKRPSLAMILAVPIAVLFYVCFPFPLDSLK
ncbi:CBO0543 family protein [Halobacillus sp. Cin3]|uniref:CBO0543 family protein n=1 Tax=Halobacillus sp. Cin3 TaxID=2928441 RepID=UPI00248E0E39|nr:CBO0543 family protein [Halobacillus sp. Cin3]